MANGEYEFLSKLEKIVYDWLARHKIPFTTQETMLAPARELGSAVVDFILPNNILVRVMGAYWHASMESEARDDLSKERLTNQGYTVIDVWEESLTKDKIERTMQMALRGEEALR